MEITMNVTVYNRNLRHPDSIAVECGKNKKTFAVGSYQNIMDVIWIIEQWILIIWKEQRANTFGFLPLPKARVFFNIDWDADNVLFCEYTAKERW